MQKGTGASTCPLQSYNYWRMGLVHLALADFEKALDAAGRDYVNYLYADVNHGFHNDTTPRYDKIAAERAWQRTIAHFTKHL